MDEFASSLEALRGAPFAKMTGSGNDFVFFDGRKVPSQLVTVPEIIAAICNRFNGIGADGLVVLEPAGPYGEVEILYFNSDGSPADLCGNATLCSTSLAVDVGLGDADGMHLTTPAGLISGRIHDGLPEIDLQPVTDVRTDIDIPLTQGETRIGFAVAGIPHLVVLCEDADAVDVADRGPGLRHHAAVGSAGANVNWVSPRSDGTWRYRTFERGVEGETLACGTGAVATAILLSAWGLASSPVAIRTSSGRVLDVRFTRDGGSAPRWTPSLRGEGRVVYRGRIESLGAAT